MKQQNRAYFQIEIDKIDFFLKIIIFIFQEEPPVFDAKGLRLRTNKFANFKEYCNIFYPLLMHELWANVFKDYMQNKDHSQDLKAHYIYKNSKLLVNLWLWYIQLLADWSGQKSNVRCIQFEPVQQSRLQALRAQCSNIYTVFKGNGVPTFPKNH